MERKYFIGTVVLDTLTNKKYIVEEVWFDGNPACPTCGKMFAVIKEMEPKESMKPRRISLPNKILDENFKILSSPHRPAFAGTPCHDQVRRWGKDPVKKVAPFMLQDPAGASNESSGNVFAPGHHYLGTLSIDIEMLPDGALDIWMSHEGSSGEHYTGITAEYAGKLVEEDIKSIAEGNGYSCA